MTKSAGEQDDDAAAFADAVRGARPLTGAQRVLPRVSSSKIGRPLANRRQTGTPRPDAAVAVTVEARLSVEETAAGWVARADGVDRRILRRLRDGAFPVDGQLDLHGLTRVKAAAALDRFLSASRASGRRCLLVIHGRGLHSGDDGPTLRDVVREALTAGPHAPTVLACSSAPPSRGGAGATLVYLRR